MYCTAGKKLRRENFTTWAFILFFFFSFLKVLLVLLLSLQSNPIQFLWTFLPVQPFLLCVTAEDGESVSFGELHHDRETKASDLLSQRTRLRPGVWLPHLWLYQWGLRVVSSCAYYELTYCLFERDTQPQTWENEREREIMNNGNTLAMNKNRSRLGRFWHPQYLNYT